MRTLCTVFSNELEDERLNKLMILSVEPAPNASRLQIIATTEGDPEAASNALQHARGFLRSEVARALQRKRAPELVFAVLPSGARNG